MSDADATAAGTDASTSTPADATGSPGAETTDPLMVLVGGSPTPEERAAVEAVLLGMADEWAETKHRRVLDTESEWLAKARSTTGHRWKRD